MGEWVECLQVNVMMDGIDILNLYNSFEKWGISVKHVTQFKMSIKIH
jgi:hypothetical protein